MMRIIDAHMHVNLGQYDPKTIVQSMSEKGVRQSWLLSWEELDPPVPEIYISLPVDRILEACNAYPDKFVPFYAPDPGSPALENEFSSFGKKGIKGVGELKVSLNWDHPAIERYLHLVENNRFLLIFHMENPRWQYRPANETKREWLWERLLNDKFNGISRYYITKFAERTGILKKKIHRNRIRFPGILFDFESLEKRIQQFPGINYIGHGPDFWNHLGSVQDPKYIHQKGAVGEFGIIDRLLESYPNFFCDLSGTSGYNAMTRDRENSRNFLLKHAKKILYGTDNTSFPLLEFLESLALPRPVMENILHKNAETLLAG